MMRRLLLGMLMLVVVVSVVQTRRRRVRRDRTGLRFTDCATNTERPIRVLDIRATPMPVVVAGTLRMSAHINLTYDLPRRVDVHVDIRKQMFGINFRVPCFYGEFGSCTYRNVCYILEPFERDGCPRVLSNHGVPCHCPFYAGDLHIQNFAINIPRITGVASYVITGNYEATIRLTGEEDYELGCLNLKFSVKKRNRGWFFRV